MRYSLSPLPAAIVLLSAVAPSSASFAQGPPNPQVLIAAQREGMAPLAYMDGVWRGKATTTLPSGQTHNITQTERIVRTTTIPRTMRLRRRLVIGYREP